MALHVVAAQRGVVQHLLTPLRTGVEDDTGAEDRRHERVGLRLVEILVGGAEEELVRFLAGQQDHMLIGQLKSTDIAALLAKSAHQSDRVGAELLEVTVLVGTAGDAPDFLQLRVTGHDPSGYFSC
jgi:hypothetical protein